MPAQLHEIEWETSLMLARQQALRRGKVLLVYFSLAPECQPCVEFEEGTLHDSEVMRFVEKYFQPVRLNLHRDAELSQAYAVTKTPTIAIVDQNNQVQHRIVGPTPPHALLGQLSLGLGKLWLDYEWFEKSALRLNKVIAQHSGTKVGDEAEYWKHVCQKRKDDGLVEEADKESFPASDPPCWTLGRDQSA